jgi:anti-anti-sigma factor
VVALRLDGALFFVTADSLEDRIHELVHTTDPPPSVVVFNCQSVNFVDAQGAGKLGEIAAYLKAKGVELRLARVKPKVMEVFERDGLVERIGPAKFHLDVEEAVEAHLEQVHPPLAR